MLKSNSQLKLEGTGNQAALQLALSFINRKDGPSQNLMEKSRSTGLYMNLPPRPIKNQQQNERNRSNIED